MAFVALPSFSHAFDVLPISDLRLIQYDEHATYVRITLHMHFLLTPHSFYLFRPFIAVFGQELMPTSSRHTNDTNMVSVHSCISNFNSQPGWNVALPIAAVHQTIRLYADA